MHTLVAFFAVFRPFVNANFADVAVVFVRRVIKFLSSFLAKLLLDHYLVLGVYVCCVNTGG